MDIGFISSNPASYIPLLTLVHSLLVFLTPWILLSPSPLQPASSAWLLMWEVQSLPLSLSPSLLFPVSLHDCTICVLITTIVIFQPKFLLGSSESYIQLLILYLLWLFQRHVKFHHKIDYRILPLSTTGLFLFSTSHLSHITTI